MIRARSTSDAPLLFDISVVGVPVYLDNDVLVDLAKGGSNRRNRFVGALRGGADLLFSMTNAIELAATQNQSFDAVKALLADIGPHWFPLGMDLGPVLHAEA